MSLQRQLEQLRASAISVPDAAGVTAVLELIGAGPPYDELFFSELKDAAWLPILEQHGYFARMLPHDASGGTRAVQRQRLPFASLARFAEQAPRLVTATLVRMPLATTLAMADQTLRCIAGIRERQSITSLRPLAVYIAETSSHAHGVWIAELLKSWTETGAKMEALAVLRAFILTAASTPSGDDRRAVNTWQMAELDRRAVEKICSEDPVALASIYFDALSRWAALRRAQESNPARPPLSPDSDPARNSPSTYWLEDFKGPASDLRDFESSLAETLYAASACVYTGNADRIEELDRLLRSDRWELFERLRWQLYADFPERTCHFARSDVLALLPLLGREDFAHGYEFAQLLHRHARCNGAAFLTSVDVANFLSTVFSGPLDPHGNPSELDQQLFWRRQLQPIEPLLKDNQLAAYRGRVPAVELKNLEHYKPIRSGGAARMIEHVSPLPPAKLAEKQGAELWSFLNDWTPRNRFERTEWWVEEDVGALATAFAEIVENHPERFPSESKWWKNIERPAILHRPLERATERIGSKEKSKASEAEWANWFGLADWIVEHSAKSNDEPSDADWGWARIVVAKFLKAALMAAGELPKDYRAEARRLVQRLINDPDPRLARGSRMGDWLTTAINSARGDAVEIALDIALQKTESDAGIESWIFETIRRRLEESDESPAIFALLGSRLRLFVHLFGETLKASPQLLFPTNRTEHREAAVWAHFQYDNPMVKVIQTFPMLLREGLTLMSKNASDQKGEPTTRRDFSTRLGVHIAFYYWNKALEPDTGGDELLAEFFSVASPEARAAVIGQIGDAFEKAKADEVSDSLQERVLYIWEQRYALIAGAINRQPDQLSHFRSELAEFTDWLRCESLPFEWRIRHVTNALQLLDSAPRVYGLVKFMTQQSERHERLAPMLQLLETLTSKANDELRWSLDEKDVRLLLERGLASADEETRRRAEAARDELLRQGFLMFLDIGAAVRS